MAIFGLFLSVLLLILNEAGIIVLSSFYIWLPFYVGLAIVILQFIFMVIAMLIFNDGKIKVKF